MGAPAEIVHGSCVCVGGHAALIIGPSGSGKSGLALALIALGARLVADDRTALEVRGNAVVASAPAAIAGLIEARGVGILSLEHVSRVPVAVVVDLSRTETARLPERHVTRLMGKALPCLYKVDAAYFPAALHTYLTNMVNDT